MMIDEPVINVDLKMTRFKYVWENISDPAIYDTITGNCYFINDEDDIERIVDLLNELSDENNILNKNEDDLKECTIENIKLKETNRQLREINKEMGDDLHNCRLNKNIISEKLKLWQDTLSEYDIYTIKDLGESFELDAKISKEKDEKIKELQVKVLNLELEIKRLEKMMWKIQWRFQHEVGIEKAREHYQEIDKEMEE